MSAWTCFACGGTWRLEDWDRDEYDQYLLRCPAVGCTAVGRHPDTPKKKNRGNS